MDKRHFKEAGLGDVRLHSTRSTGSSTSLIAGMNISDVLAAAGWLNVNTFVRNYMRPIGDAPQLIEHPAPLQPPEAVTPAKTEAPLKQAYVQH